MSRWVKYHLPCPKCGSSDAMSVNDKGWGKCFSCGSNIPLDKDVDKKYIISKDTLVFSKSVESVGSPLLEKDYTKQIIPFRGLNEHALKTYGVKARVNNEGKPFAIEFPYGDGCYKLRDYERKDFRYEGDRAPDHTLFGMDKFPPASNLTITITEGEIDAISAFQMMGSKYPVVSVRNAQGARGDCEKAYKYLNSFEKIYLAFDNDEPGQKAATEVAKLFDINKVYHVQMGGEGFKDANDYLKAGRQEQFNKTWWNAKKFLPKGIINSYEEIKATLLKNRRGSIADYPFSTLQEMTYGIREGELVLFTAQEKVGKGLPLDTELPTLDGWTTIADLKVGDKLVGRDGKECSVTGLSQVHNLDCYKIRFQDGTEQITDAVHRWLVRDLQNKELVIDTKTMFDNGVIDKGSKARYMIPVVEPIDTPEVELPIDPLLFGAWLADGHSYSAYVCLPEKKLKLLDKYTIRKVYEEKSNCNSYMFEELTHTTLSKVGVLKNKHIPSIYLRSSKQQRQELMKGLCFDGWMNDYYTSNPTLLDGFLELARSLGYTCKVRYREDTQSFTVRYKLKKYKAIRSIEQVGSVPTKCLTVDSKDSLFVCGKGWNLTHNTEILRALEYHLLKNTDENIGIIHLEEEEKRSVQGLLSYELNTPVHLPDCQVTVEEQLATYQKLTKRDGRLHFYTHFGSDDPDTILETIRYLVGVCHCKFIFLDHITMLVTGYEGDDERKKLDYISTRLAMLTRELGFTLFLVSHVNDNGQTRGSRNISKVADLIVHLDRDNEAADFDTRNTTSLLVKGNRFAGVSGPAGHLIFNPQTYQVREKTLETAQEVERF